MTFGKIAVLVTVALLIGTGLVGCGGSQTVAVETLREIPSPPGLASGQPNLAIGPGGEIYLSWIETGKGSPALKFATRKGDNWSQPQTIVQGEDLMVNYADYPSLLPLPGGSLAAHWMTLIPNAEGYNVNIAFSKDDGRTWSKPVIPHHDRTPTEHGFVSLTPAADGGLGVIWLDSRKAVEPGGSEDETMMYTKVDADSKLGSELLIDNRVCECCQPAAIQTKKGILTVYRDRSENEIRDIAIARYDGNKWSEPRTVFADGWKIQACPINGPAIAAREDRVAVAWFTAPNDKPKVEAAFSTNGGDTFGAPVQIDDGNPLGRVDVISLGSGSAVVTWLERGDKGGQVRARQVDADGTRHASFVIGPTSLGTAGGFPRLQLSGNNVIFAWTDPNEDRVRVSMMTTK